MAIAVYMAHRDRLLLATRCLHQAERSRLDSSRSSQGVTAFCAFPFTTHQAFHRSACDPGREATAGALRAAWAGSSDLQEGVGRIDFPVRSPDTGAMGVRTRGLDIKAGAAKLKADRVAVTVAAQDGRGRNPFGLTLRKPYDS
jgi:hypothetical protein